MTYRDYAATAIGSGDGDLPAMQCQPEAGRAGPATDPLEHPRKNCRRAGCGSRRLETKRVECCCESE